MIFLVTARRIAAVRPVGWPHNLHASRGQGPLQLVPERRAAQQNFWPAACGELQATAKTRTVGRVIGGQFARSLRRSRVRAQYRARGPRPQVVAADREVYYYRTLPDCEVYYYRNLPDRKGNCASVVAAIENGRALPSMCFIVKQ